MMATATPAAIIAPAKGDYFAEAFAFVVSAEGVLSLERGDPGNWTGGKVGEGELKGSKFGLSAAQYPTLDFASLTLDQAAAIYRRDYWQLCRCDELPRRLALVVFDSAVNQGQGTAVELLQASLGVTVDGALGPQTLAAVARSAELVVVGEFCARRMLRYAQDPRLEADGLGWFRRVARLLLESALTP